MKFHSDEFIEQQNHQTHNLFLSACLGTVDLIDKPYCPVLQPHVRHTKVAIVMRGVLE
jgi:hypothetical protein